MTTSTTSRESDAEPPAVVGRLLELLCKQLFSTFFSLLLFKSRLKSVQTVRSAAIFWNRHNVSSGIFSLMTLKRSLAGKCRNKPGSCCCVFCTVLLFYVGCVDAAAVFCDVLHVSPCFFFSVLFVVSISQRDFHIVTLSLKHGTLLLVAHTRRRRGDF